MASVDFVHDRIWRQVIVSTVILIAVVGASVALVVFLRQDPAPAAPVSSIPSVRTASVGLHKRGLTLEADGVVVPYRSIDISTEVAGRVVQRTKICRAGNYVEAGTLLYKIDPSDYLLSVEQLEKDVTQASVALTELQEQIDGAGEQIEVAAKELALRQRELKRQQNLGSVVTSADLERAEANELMARNNLITLKNKVKLYGISRARLEGARDVAASKLAKAKLDLQRTEIKSPVTGVIVREQAEQDSFVQRGTLLVTIEDTSKTEVKCKLEMEDLYWLWDRPSQISGDGAATSAPTAYDIPESPVEVVYRIAGSRDLEYVWDGRLARYDGIGLDERTRTVPCRVVVDQPLQRRTNAPGGPPALVRGMFVTIRIQTQTKTPILDVPEEALRAGNVVWRVRDDTLTIQPVNFITLLESNKIDPIAPQHRRALIWILDRARLKPGDQVVVSPLDMAYSGMPVSILKAPAIAASAKGPGE